MGFAILEPKESVVKGTVQLFDDSTEENGLPGTEQLKHSKDGKVVLNPQPTDFPGDPLNWPLWRRDLSFAILVMASILSGTHGPILAPVTLELALKWNTTITAINQLSSYSTLTIAIFAYLASAVVRIFGKRGILVVGCVILVVSDAWAAVAMSYGSFLGARILSGVGQTVFEALVLATIPDLYFVHERGSRIAAFIYGLQAGVFLGVPIATQIIESAGLKWAFGGLAIAEGAVLVLIFFFFKETAFRRDHVDVLAHQDRAASTLPDAHGDEAKSDNQRTEITGGSDAPSLGPTPRPASYWSTISLYHGRFSDRSIVALLARTIALTLHPTILWTACTGLPASWLVGISFTINALLAAPPYNMSSVAIGNMYIAGWLGCTAGLILAMPNDWLVKRIAKRNNNVYEPEFRLVLVAPAIFLVVFGLAAWGWGGQAGTPWVGMAFFFAIACAGAVLINSALISFVIDAHREYAVESQVILFAFKNFFPFGMGYFFVEWWMKDGNRMVWGVMSGVSAALALLGVLFYVFGKRLRAFWMRHPFLGTAEGFSGVG